MLNILKFVLKRILIMIPVLLGVIFIVFTINRMSPGDPIAGILGSSYTQEQYDAKAEELGLDDPFFVQFVNYIKGIVTELDLGVSYKTGREVSDEIFDRLPTTVKLGLIGCAITVLLGVPFGIISATRQYSVLDHSVTIFSLVFASMPGFWLALMLIIIFALNLKALPASMAGVVTWRSWILPAASVGLSPVASITRLTRSSMLDVVRQDYIRTARSKGLGEGYIVRRHALKNALIPVITSVGLQLGMLLSGSVVVEAIFSIPGLGTLMTTAINSKDYPIIQGCVVVLATIICCINLLTDIAYGFVDPRIMSRITGGGKKRPKKTAQAAAEVN